MVRALAVGRTGRSLPTGAPHMQADVEITLRQQVFTPLNRNFHRKDTNAPE